MVEGKNIDVSAKGIYKKYAEIVDKYLAELRTITPSSATIASYTNILNSFGEWLNTEFDAHNAPVDGEITPQMISGWKQKVINRPVKMNTLRHYLIVLNAFFKWSIKNDFYKNNPIDANSLPKEQQIRLSLLSEKEIEKILAGKLPRKMQKSKAMRNRAIIFVFLQCGLRNSELRTLTPKMLNFDNGTIAVHGKGDKWRTVTFPKQAQQYVSEYMNSGYRPTYVPANEALFGYIDTVSGEWTPFSRQGMTLLVRHYIYTLIGRDDIGSHDLRHAYASYLLTHNVPLDMIQKLLGHSHYGTTLKYAERLCPEKMIKDINSIFDRPTKN